MINNISSDAWKYYFLLWILLFSSSGEHSPRYIFTRYWYYVRLSIVPIDYFDMETPKNSNKFPVNNSTITRCPSPFSALLHAASILLNSITWYFPALSTITWCFPRSQHYLLPAAFLALSFSSSFAFVFSYKNI